MAEDKPVVNQVQFSPFEFRRGLLERAMELEIALEAYSPLGTGRHLGDATVAAIAQRLERTPAQVLIRWAIERDLIVLPKSTHRERIEENAQVFDFTLTDEDVAALDALDTTGGTSAALRAEVVVRLGHVLVAARRATRSRSPSLGARQSPRGDSEPPRADLRRVRERRALELADLEEAVEEDAEPLLDRREVVLVAALGAGSGPATDRARDRPTRCSARNATLLGR